MDIHTETAKRMFHTNEITPEMRLAAKRKNFMELYGCHNKTLGDLKDIEPNQFNITEVAKRLASMSPILNEALEIKNLADSEQYSDSHITEMSEKFKAKYGCNWTDLF